MNVSLTRVREDLFAQKRERTLHAAVQLFYERGFTGTTLDDVAHALGVTKPFIYTHFRGKSDLLAAICVPAMQACVDAAEAACAQAGDAARRLHRLVAGFCEVALEHQLGIAVFFRESKHLDPEAAEKIKALRERFDALLSQLIAEGSASGAFLVPDVRLAALAIGGMVTWSYEWHRAEGRLPIEELAARMADLALRMVGA